MLLSCLRQVKVKQKLPGVGGDGGGVTSSAWGGGRPYANAHVVLEANERVMDAKFQPLRTVAELSAWGYRVGVFSWETGWGVNVACWIRTQNR